MPSRVATLLFISALWACSPRGPGADLVLRGGQVYTSNPDQPWAEALAVEAGILRAVGTNSEMDDFIGLDTIVVELDGRLVLPGLNDCDVDFLKGSVDLDKALLDEAASIRDVQDIVLAHAKAHPEIPWILGAGLQLSHLESALSRYDLDEAVPDRPVLLEAYDGQAAWVNSKALLLAGIDSHTTGNLAGQTLARVQRVIPRPSRDQHLDALRRGIAYANRFGITGIHTDVGEVGKHHYDLFEELVERGELTVRVDAVLTVTRQTTDAELEAIERHRNHHDSSWLEFGGARIELDGEVESHSAAMLGPYHDDPSTAGEPAFTQNALNLFVEKIDQHNIPIIVRAKGDRAVRMALDAYEKLENMPSRRHRIEGIEFISRVDVPRLAGLGAVACLQPFRASPDFVSSWDRVIGPLRLENALAFKSLEASGAPLAFGSRWPMFDLDPMLGIHAAVNRQNLDGKPERGWNPGERLSLEEALTAYTMGGAFCGFDDDVRGTFEEGKMADLVVLSEDLFRIPARRIAEIEAIMTIVGGQTVYLTPGFVPKETEDMLFGRSYNNR